MEPLVEELLNNHNIDKDLTRPDVQQEVRELRIKHNRVDDDLGDNEQLVGLDWRASTLEDFHFEKTILSKMRKEAHFEGANLTNAHFENADLSYGWINHADVRGTNFENCIFTGLDYEDSSYFKYAKFSKIDESDISAAIAEYRNLERIFKEYNMNHRSSIFYYRKRTVETKEYWDAWLKNILDIRALIAGLIHSLWWILCGYCERPKRSIGMIVLIIGISGLIYHFVWSGPINKAGLHVNSLWDSLYFSGVTFTTLGFGDLSPDPNIIWMKLFSFGEAFVGAFMMALFVITLVRKLSR